MKKAVNRFIPRTRKLGTSMVKKLDISSIQDFYILLDDPHKIYTPGDQIKGEIFLILNRNLLNVSIDLSLIGNIKVKNSISTSSLRTKKKTLFNHVIRIYPGFEQTATANDEANDSDSDDLKNGLTKGQHIFPFIAQLPKDNIFTSISFEKGAISYKLKASISDINSEDESPLFTCEKLLSVVKPINVAALPPSKIKSLIVKYPTKKLKKTISQTSTINSSSLSVMSMDNGATNNGLPSPDSPIIVNSSKENSDRCKITLSLELPQLGYLRGELVPVKISLQHIKRVKNIHGIIITLIRICKVDFGPDGPIQSYRKDLSQTIVPLFVDPITFKAEINSSVRVPADAFPTIVGNEVVTFHYSIEVIVNLSNSKGLSNHIPDQLQDDEDLNGVSQAGAQSQANGTAATDFFASGANNQVNPSNIFNVDKLKRMKNVLTLSTELVVGTKRKERHRSSNRVHRSRASADGVSISESSTTAQSTPVSNDNYVQPPSIEVSPLDTHSPLETISIGHNVRHTPSIDASSPHSIRQQPPALPQFDNLTEKQLLQLRESSLLPSEPVYHTNGDDSSHPPTDSSNNGGGPLGRVTMLSHHSSNEAIDYVPMYEEYQSGSPNVNIEGSRGETVVHELEEGEEGDVEDDDDLYTGSKLATQIEGINVDVNEGSLSLETVHE